MRNIKKLLCAGILVSALALNVQAGHMITGVTQPAPTPTPESSASATASENDASAQPASSDVASEGYVTDAFLGVLQALLALL